MYKSLRLVDNVKIRHPKKRINGLFVKGVEANGLIGQFPMVHFQQPGFLRSPNEHPMSWVGTKLEVKSKEPKVKDVWRGKSSSKIQFELSFDLDSYALIMAKIGHCIAVGALGVNNFDHWVVPYILGHEKEGLPFFTGGTSKPEDPVRTQHETKYDVFPYSGPNNLKYYISVTIRLFAYIGGPHTKVIVGATDEERFQQMKQYLKRK
jgi:hypothetical protein